MSRARSGFTLVETLVALAILGATLLLGMSLIAQQPRVRAKVRAHHEAQAAVASVLEGLRAGTVPLTPGLVPTPTAADAADGLLLRLEVAADPRAPGLAHLTVTAHYQVDGQLMERRVETLTWTGPAGPAPASRALPPGRAP